MLRSSTALLHSFLFSTHHQQAVTLTYVDGIAAFKPNVT
jgi:hypothetical protein